MARPFANIKDLNELSRFPRIGVRITTIWVVQAKPKRHLEMLVMDSQMSLQLLSRYILQESKWLLWLSKISIRRARIKEPQGKYGIALANAYNNVTKVLTNQEIHEIKEFKRSFLMLTSSCIKQKQKDIHCVTVCDIVDFIPNKVGWFYDACKKCTKRRPEMKTDGPFKCTNQPKCNAFNDHSIPRCRYVNISKYCMLRYKLEIKVAYNEGTANFDFWDEQCAQIIGQSAKQLWKEMLELGENDRKSYIPNEAGSNAGKKIGSPCQGTTKVQFGSVLRLSREAEYIQAILDQIGDDEGTSKMVDSKSSIKLLQFAEQSLSAMADHDPEELTNVTPAKRIGSEELVVEDIPSAQLSSTKLKTIKTE